LRAPEETTEEFLADLRRSDALIPVHRNLLAAFLNACDLVKFAAHQPAMADIQTAFDHVKRFILETVPVAPAASSTSSDVARADKERSDTHAV
jgi:hypothetical protein